MDLAGKVAIVTGGAIGIGFAACRALAEEGAAVVIADLSGGSAAADKLRSKGHKATHVDADVFDRGRYKSHGGRCAQNVRGARRSR